MRMRSRLFPRRAFSSAFFVICEVLRSHANLLKFRQHYWMLY